MPARGGGSSRKPSLSHQIWTEDGLQPHPPNKRRYQRKPKKKKRFHQAFRVLIALGLVPSKSRQTDPLGLRVKKRMAEDDLGKLIGKESKMETTTAPSSPSSLQPSPPAEENGLEKLPSPVTEDKSSEEEPVKIKEELEDILEEEGKVAAEEETEKTKECRSTPMEVEKETKTDEVLETQKSAVAEQQSEDGPPSEKSVSSPSPPPKAMESTTESLPVVAPRTAGVRAAAAGSSPSPPAASEVASPPPPVTAAAGPVASDLTTSSTISSSTPTGPSSISASSVASRKRPAGTPLGKEPQVEGAGVGATGGGGGGGGVGATPAGGVENDASSESGDSDSSRKRSRTAEPLTNCLPNGGNRFPPSEDERERVISEFVSDVSLSAETIADAAERLAKEVESLAELAAQKELEWNAILRVKKLKEEMLERVLRRKRMNHFDSQLGLDPLIPDIPNNKVLASALGSPLVRHPRLAEMGRLPQHQQQHQHQRPILPKPGSKPPSYPVTPGGGGLLPGAREGRNGPVVDVKSIIDDYSGYRSRHPENPAGGAVRRGRRSRTSGGGGSAGGGGGAHIGGGGGTDSPTGGRYPAASVNPSLISMANMALGTGASVRTVSDHLGYMGIDVGGGGGGRGGGGGGAETGKERGGGGGGQQQGTGGGGGGSLNPEVTLHPVSPPSLLHQVLTKATPARPTNFSPTLARLLTAPERPPPPPPFRPPPNRASIAEILSSSKLKDHPVASETIDHFPTILTVLAKERDEATIKEEEDSENQDPSTSSLSADPPNDLQVREKHRGPGRPPRKTKHTIQIRRPPTPHGKKAVLAEVVEIVRPISPTSQSNSSTNSKDSLEEVQTQVSQQVSQQHKQGGPKIILKKQPKPRQIQVLVEEEDEEPQIQPPPAKKSRNEITITPVTGNPPMKKEDVVCLDDEDNESGDRLVIDEGGEEVPACQGCRSKSAQFVCAGCGNQWYCSRECQVSAWEEHSDMCSG